LIRQANKYDNDKIIELLKDFAIKSNNPLTNNPLAWSKTYIEQILAILYAGHGFILIDDNQTDILVAAKTKCFWLENVWQLQEVMLTGNNKFVVARLIKEYIKIAKDMVNKGEITQAIMASYKDLRFERYGMVKLEQHWEIK
jgi:hypothetical protein